MKSRTHNAETSDFYKIQPWVGVRGSAPIFTFYTGKHIVLHEYIHILYNKPGIKPGIKPGYKPGAKPGEQPAGKPKGKHAKTIEPTCIQKNEALRPCQTTLIFWKTEQVGFAEFGVVLRSF